MLKRKARKKLEMRMRCQENSKILRRRCIYNRAKCLTKKPKWQVMCPKLSLKAIAHLNQKMTISRQFSKKIKNKNPNMTNKNLKIIQIKKVNRKQN
jgi:hypothetical protein